MLVTARPKVIAHRGASAHALENTIAAFDLALDLGADVLELDVRAMADGEPVVLHDSTLARTAHDPRSIGHLTAAELRALPPAVRPPLLEEALTRYGSTTDYLIDLKWSLTPVERRAAEVVARHGLEAHVEFQTFSRRALRRMRSIAVRAPLSLLYPAHLPSTVIRHDIGHVAAVADAIGPHASSVDAGLVAAAHRHGLRVEAYTVDEPDEAERLLDLGVDGIVTGAPERIRQVVDERGTFAAVA